MSAPFRIGVTGHRDLGDEVTAAFVAGQCKAILQEALTEHGGVLALSALSEGADTLFAEAALELDIPLEAVTPFERYVEDFKGQAQERYERLLAQARVEHRLPYTERSEAYLAGGLWVVDHCDLLVAVWDGQPAAGKGGTGDVVDYARQVGRPFIHIHTVERTVTYSSQGGQKMDKFEEYRLFVEDGARFTERRQAISNTYVTVNSLLLAAIGLLIKDLGARGIWTLLLPLPLVVAGIVVSLWWRQLIHKYKALVGLRIDTLRKMEESPEMAGSVKMYHVEDELYPRDAEGNMIPGQGLSFSDLEVRLPWLFLVLYGLFGVVLLIVLAVRVVLAVLTAIGML